jgi:nicotinamide riboside kinase
MRNVYIIGAQSTGKSTLVNALDTSYKEEAADDHSASLQPPSIIREVARTVLKEKGFSREDIIMSPIRALRLQQYILEAQYNTEAVACTSDTAAWFICDRSGLDPIVYAKCFTGSEASAHMLASKIWLELEGRMKKSIVILCEAGNHWLIDDGIRLMPNDMEEWAHVDKTFRGLLEWRGISYSVIPKHITDVGKRVKYVRGVIDAACEQEF